MIKPNRLCDILQAVTEYGFNNLEIETVKVMYKDAASHYRITHPEPEGITERLDYAEMVKEYSAAVTRKYIANKLDAEQTRLEL